MRTTDGAAPSSSFAPARPCTANRDTMVFDAENTMVRGHGKANRENFRDRPEFSLGD